MLSLASQATARFSGEYLLWHYRCWYGLTKDANQQMKLNLVSPVKILPKKDTRYKKVSQGMIIKSRWRTSFLSCVPGQPFFSPETIPRRIAYYERPLFLALPFVRVGEPIERGHLLCMLSVTVVTSLLVRYRRAMPTVAVAFFHRAR